MNSGHRVICVKVMFSANLAHKSLIQQTWQPALHVCQHEGPCVRKVCHLRGWERSVVLFKLGGIIFRYISGPAGLEEVGSIFSRSIFLAWDIRPVIMFYVTFHSKSVKNEGQNQRSDAHRNSLLS